MLFCLKGIWEERAQKVRQRGRVVLCCWQRREADCFRFRSERGDLAIGDHRWWVIMRVKENGY